MNLKNDWRRRQCCRRACYAELIFTVVPRACTIEEFVIRSRVYECATRCRGKGGPEGYRRSHASGDFLLFSLVTSQLCHADRSHGRHGGCAAREHAQLYTCSGSAHTAQPCGRSAIL